MSTLEGLPAEIRQHIYGYLDYPVAGTFLVDSRDPLSADRKLFRITGYDIWHSTILPAIIPRTESVDHDSVAPSMPWGRCRRYFDPVLFEIALLAVNKFIRKEVIGLLRFGDVQVTFHFLLSNQPIYPNVANHPVYGRTRPVPFRPDFTHPLRLTPFFFAQLTNVSLSSDIADACRHDCPVRRPKSLAHEILAMQAESVHYIASHCPQLKTFLLNPFLKACMCRDSTCLIRPQDVLWDAMVPLFVAIMILVQKCTLLETINIPSTVEYYVQRGGQLPCLEEDWFRDEVLLLAEIDRERREEVASNWVGETLERLRVSELIAFVKDV